MADTVAIPENSLVVVADGHRATLFRSHGGGDELSLVEERRLTPKDLAEEGPSGSRPEEQTPRQTNEATFAKQLAQALNLMKLAHKFDHLVLAADPQTLGQVKEVLHKEVSSSLVLALDKELTNHSSADIAKIVRNAAG